MGWWSASVVPRLVHASLSQPPVMERRAAACAGLHGRVLEIGFGSGLNIAVLPPEVTQVDAVEPNDAAWRRSHEARAAADLPVERIGLDGQRIEGADGTYDAALCTFSMCTIPDPKAALREVYRLLRPGAVLHVLEHGAAPDAGVRRWQRRLEPVQRRVFDGCHLTRDPVALLEAAGFATDDVRRGYLAPGPARPFTFLTSAIAARR